MKWSVNNALYDTFQTATDNDNDIFSDVGNVGPPQFLLVWRVFDVFLVK